MVNQNFIFWKHVVFILEHQAKALPVIVYLFA